MAHRRTGGFTLLEILIVVAIVGIIVAMASVNFTDSDATQIKREAERMQALLEHVNDEAIATGETFGFGPDLAVPGRYAFWKMNALGAWIPVDTIETLRSRDLPAGMHITAIEVNRTTLPAEEHIRFAPSGVNAPFSLMLTQGHDRLTVESDAMGRITFGNHGEPSATPQSAR
ncbi:GspH/FimT family pseudopilin [Burkholderiaceae bacterium DAT-1]|nr:GspH/FimT family pseudopilin [Burkholderiaceae bacterium DAT-1]